MSTSLLSRIIIAIIPLLLLTPNKTNASHMAGGEIYYEFTGDSANPYNYRVWLLFFRDVGGIPAPLNPSLCVTSSCYTDALHSMTFEPFVLKNPGQDTSYGSYPGSILTPYVDQCIDSNSIGTFVQTEIYRFYVDVTLDGSCTDWTFSFAENARNSNDNLSLNGTFYVEAQLNNTFGPNNSAVFIDPPGKIFCVGRHFVWSQAAIQSDNTDSIYIDFGIPENATGFPPDCPLYPQASGFNTGYSQSQPITTSSGITVDHRKGTFSFTPSQPEVVVVNIEVIEYRFDTISLSWLNVGKTVRDVQISVLNNCDTTKTPIDVNVAGYVDNSYTIPQCGDSIIHLKTTSKINCSSIAADGSDFAIYDGHGGILPIIEAGSDHCNFTYTNDLWLKLFQPISNNDTLILESRVGNDGNTLLNMCSDSLSAGQTIPIIIDNCPSNIDLQEYLQPTISLYPNPAGKTINLAFPENLLGDLRLKLVDNSGNIIKSWNEEFQHRKELTLDISSLPFGMYSIVVEGNTGISSEVFIKH